MSAIDYAVIALYAALTLGIGLYTSRFRPSASDLLLGGRALPAWAVLFSMVATELSAATFIGVPHAAYTGSWSYLQLAFGAFAGKLVIAKFVIPLYYRLEVVTVYGLLRERYGERAQRAAAIAFAAGRVLASGVRLFIAALAFSAIADQPIEISILVSGSLALAYTLAGGIRSVVWTDVLQGLVFVTSLLAMLWVLGRKTDGGLAEIVQWAEAGGRMQVFHGTPLFSLESSTALGTAIVGGFFLTLATHSTDHDMVQRLLTTRDGRSGGRALAGSALLNFPLTMLFLFVGTGIAYLHTTPPAYELARSESVLPFFALHEMPSGARGLVFAGLFAAAMSSLDSAICAIASTWVSDIAPTPGAADDTLVRRMRRASWLTGLALIGAALAMAAYHRALSQGTAGISLVEFALSSMTILYGGLLGIFARAMLSKRRSDGAAVAGLVAGSLVGLVLFLHPVVLGRTWIAWTWWVPLSASVAYATSGIGAGPGAGSGTPASRASGPRTWLDE